MRSARSRLCLTCSKFDEALFESLGVCPSCGEDLLKRIADRERMRFRRSASHIAHPYELEYGDTPVLESGIPLRHEKLDFIEYAYGLIRVASIVINWAAGDGDFGIGFLTGSAPLMWLLRELYPARLADRVKYVPGLAHSGQDAESHLQSALNYNLASGMRRLFVVDEVVSGTQFRTNAIAIERWAHQFHSTHPLPVLLVGLQPARSKVSYREVCGLLRGAKRHNHPRISRLDIRIIKVPELIASDGRGRLFKGLRKGRRQPGYFNSRWRTDGYTIACARETSMACARYEVLATAGSMDQVFGAAIRLLLKPSKSAVRPWPDLALCPLCEDALKKLRESVANLPQDGQQEAVSLGSLKSIRERAKRRPLIVVPSKW